MHDDDLLYHYTDAAGLLGLLGTPQLPAALWMTQIQYMNDAEEWYHAFYLARDQITSPSRRNTGLFEAMKGLYGTREDGVPSELAPGSRGHFGMERSFVFSLSEEKDLLSQWRGYAPDGGYSIGYRFGDLQKLANAGSFALISCLYDDEMKGKRLDEMIDMVEKTYAAEEVDEFHQAIEHLSAAEKVRGTASSRFQSVFRYLASSFKHSSFAEEREWRLVGTVPVHDARSRWRSRHNQIIPYCSVDISDSGPCPLLPREIITGPGVDSLLAHHAISFMGTVFNKSLSIKPSKSTLRR